MQDENDKPLTSSLGQKVFAALIAVVTILYILLAINGWIKSLNRLTAADLGVVVVAALVIAVALRPDYLDRLQKFDFGGLKIELGQVKRNQIEVQKRQEEQMSILQDVRLALRLLIGQNERKHLANLLSHTTANYHLGGAVREELRRLRAMGLIRMHVGKTIGGMPDNGTFDLAEYVELTEDGFKFISRLNERPGAVAAGDGGG